MIKHIERNIYSLLKINYIMFFCSDTSLRKESWIGLLETFYCVHVKGMDLVLFLCFTPV